MTKQIKIHKLKRSAGDIDYHYVDDNNNKIATLLSNSNERGYILIFHIDIPNYKPIEVKSLMSGSAMVRKTLNSNGYHVTNKFLS